MPLQPGQAGTGDTGETSRPSARWYALELVEFNLKLDFGRRLEVLALHCLLTWKQA